MRARNLLPPLFVLVVALLLYVLGGGDRRPASPDPDAAPAHVPEPDPSDAPLPEPERPAHGDRAALPSLAAVDPAADPTVEAPSSDSEPQSFGEVHVRVLDVEGRPLAGVPIRVSARAPGDSGGLLSDDIGDVTIRIAVGKRVRVSVDSEREGPRFASVRSTYVSTEATPTPAFVIAAPAVRLAGTVVDPAGLPIEGAEISIPLGNWSLARFPFPLDASIAPTASTSSDASGAFSLGSIPFVADKHLICTLDGYESLSTDIPSHDRLDLRLRMTALLEEVPLELTGTVLLPSGAPAFRATVQFGSEKATTDQAGRFQLPLKETPSPGPLSAGLGGYGPAWLPDFGAHLLEELPSPPSPVTLVLTEPHAISGRVLDADGTPLEGWSIEIRDLSALAAGFFPAPSAEALAGTPKARSDDEGRFELTGLRDRSYLLWTFSERSLEAIEAGDPVPADTTDLELRQRPDDLFATLSGRVESLGGRPLAGISVGVQRVMAKGEMGEMSMSVGGATTGKEGRFLLHRLPVNDTSLSVSGSAVMPRLFPIAQDPSEEGLHLHPGEEIILRVEARCHFRVTLAEPDVGNAFFQILDDEGTPLILFQFQGGGSMSTTRWSLPPGEPSPMLATSERARTLVLSVAGEVVHEEPLFLDPAKPTEVEVRLP